jgi:hypothetical protein
MPNVRSNLGGKAVLAGTLAPDVIEDEPGEDESKNDSNKAIALSFLYHARSGILGSRGTTTTAKRGRPEPASRGIARTLLAASALSLYTYIYRASSSGGKPFGFA